MKRQTKADRMDESLGERRGKESGKKQSYASRRHESKGMHEALEEAHEHLKAAHRHLKKHAKKK